MNVEIKVTRDSLHNYKCLSLLCLPNLYYIKKVKIKEEIEKERKIERKKSGCSKEVVYKLSNARRVCVELRAQISTRIDYI